MLYAPEWMDKNYYIPMSNIERRLFGGGGHVSLSVGFGDFPSTLHRPLNTGYGGRADIVLTPEQQNKECCYIILFLLVFLGVVYFMFSLVMKNSSLFK